MMRKNMLQLDKVLDMLIDKLQDKGVIAQNVDKSELVERTKKNLTDALGEGNLPKGELLRSPMMLMKLTLSLVAAHKNTPQQQKTTQKIMTVERHEQLQEVAEDLALDLVMLKFIQKSLENQKEKFSSAPDSDPEKKEFMLLCDNWGNWLGTLKGVRATAPGKGNRMLTPQEAAGQGIHLSEEIEDRANSLANTPSLTP